MRIPRLLLVAVSAGVLGGALAVPAAAQSPLAAAPAGHPGVRLTASFLAEARAALVRGLRTPDTAILLHNGPRPGGIRLAAKTARSFNWAGYADVSTRRGTFTKVKGSWTVPAVTCTAEDRITSDWVGLDGFSDRTVEQDGTASQCFEGTALYYSWYEMYPAGTVEVGRSVAAGDSIRAAVTHSGSRYTLWLTDSTNPANSFRKTARCSTSTCKDTSAEWIAERPAYADTGIAPEAQFGTVTFSSASQTAKGTTGTISGFAGTRYEMTCVDSTRSYDIVATSGLTGGNTFTSTWQNSY